MAKETTDVFEIMTRFENEAEKLQHMLRLFNKTMAVDHLETSDLDDTFKIKLAFKDPQQKFHDFFHKGEWVKSYKILAHKSTELVDEFKVEVVYKGGQKEFKKTFHHTGYKAFDFQTNRVSSKTANLGVLNPYGKVVTKSQKEVLEICKAYFSDILIENGFTKKGKIPEKTATTDFSIGIIGGSTYHSMHSSRLVCVHLAGWKIGLLPKEGDEERFNILVSKPGYHYSRNKNPSYELNLQDHGIPGRVESVVDPVRTWNKKRIYKELFLGNPKIGEVMATFFKTISKA